MKFVSLFVLLFVLTACGEGPAIDDQTYPWQIKITDAGNNQVFGIELGVTPLGHAIRTLNDRYEVGLFENKQGQLSLEAFFNELTRGGLSGKLIIQLKTNAQQLQDFKARSVKSKPQESGVIKHTLSHADKKLTEQLLVSSLSYIPYVNLDKDMIEKRFGKADEIIKSQDQLVHFIYKDKGLDIIQSEDGKEVLQYVQPHRIQQLLRPLKRP